MIGLFIKSSRRQQ